jgi:DNA-binding transcriptional regulator YiaG
MTNHPDRSKKNRTRAATPTVEEIRAARNAAGLTAAQAAQIVYHSLRAWQYWEDDSMQGNRRMPAAAFELFLLKTGQLSLDEVMRQTSSGGRPSS